MNKIFDPTAWQLHDTPCTLVPLVHQRNPLGSADRLQLSKRASASLLDKVAALQLHAGEWLAHLIALGDTERYGPNRNGDGFKAAACRKYHPTFVKCARIYRDHAAGDPHNSFGRVVASDFNEDMHRVELLVAFNGTKEAAAKNQGKLADQEIEKLAAGRDLAVSMGCQITHDECSHCGNKAKTRADYCDELMCKAGGLKHNMGRLLGDGSILHADNPEPTFKDISHVTRPADRIAYVTGLLHKAAAAAHIIGGAELAELWDDENRLPDGCKIATLISAYGDSLPEPNLMRAINATPHALPAVEFAQTYKVAEVTTALAQAGVVLPVLPWLQLFNTQADKTAAAAIQCALPHAWRTYRPVTDNAFLFSGAGVSRKLAQWAHDIADDYGVLPPQLTRRVARAILRDAPTTCTQFKVAHATGPAAALADLYVTYATTAAKQLPGAPAIAPATWAVLALQNGM